MYLEDPRPAPDRPGKEPLAPLPEPLPQPPTPQCSDGWRLHSERISSTLPTAVQRTPDDGAAVTADSIQSKWSLTQASRSEGEWVRQGCKA